MDKKSGKKSGAANASRLKAQKQESGHATGNNHTSGKLFNQPFGDINFQVILENAPDGIVLINQEGKYKYVSPAALRIFGFSSDDLIDPEQLTHPDDLQKVLQTLHDISVDPTRVIKIQ